MVRNWPYCRVVRAMCREGAMSDNAFSPQERAAVYRAIAVNIGNPENEASIEELGEMLLASFEKHPLRHHFPPFAGFRVVESSSYYGKGYQDVEHRKPSIRNAHRCLDWEPKIDMQETIDETLDFFLRTVDFTDKPS